MTEHPDAAAVRAELDQLVEGQPEVADWPARVRSTARRRRQRQALLTGAAAAVAALLVVGTGLALGGSSDTLEPVASPPSHTESAEPSATPPPPEPDDPASTLPPDPAAPERSADATDTPRAQRTTPPPGATEAPAAQPPADRAPRRRVEVLVDVSGPVRAEAGKEVVFAVRVRAPDGRPGLYSYSFGDMSSHGDPAPCGDPPPTPAPAPYDQTTQVPYTFERPGTYEVAFGASIFCQHVDGGGTGRTTIEITESTEPPPPLSGGFLSTDVRQGGEPRPLAPGTQLSVRFDKNADGTQLTWTSGCSRYGAPVVVGEQQLDVKDIATADLDCDQQQEEQDEWLRRFFAADPAWQLSNNGRQLVLTVGDLRIQLERSS